MVCWPSELLLHMYDAFRIERRMISPVTILHMEHNSIRKIWNVEEGAERNSHETMCKGIESALIVSKALHTLEVGILAHFFEFTAPTECINVFLKNVWRILHFYFMIFLELDGGGQRRPTEPSVRGKCSVSAQLNTISHSWILALKMWPVTKKLIF